LDRAVCQIEKLVSTENTELAEGWRVLLVGIHSTSGGEVEMELEPGDSSRVMVVDNFSYCWGRRWR
jgi:hypothetical protein